MPCLRGLLGSLPAEDGAELAVLWGPAWPITETEEMPGVVLWLGMLSCRLLLF